jgi:hypothetical protein
VIERKLCFLATLAVLTSGSLAMAQESADLAPGARIRVTAPGAGRVQVVGNILTLDEKAITIVNDGQPVKVPRELITRLEVSWGRKRHVLPALLIGAAVGGLLGAASPLCSSDLYGQTTCLSRGELIGYGIAGGAGTGAIVGAFVKSDKWVELPVDRFRVSLGPGLDGRGVGLSLGVAFK